MGLEAHACSLRVFVTLHVSGAVGIHWTVHMVLWTGTDMGTGYIIGGTYIGIQWTGTDMGTGYTIGGTWMGIHWTVHMVQWTETDMGTGYIIGGTYIGIHWTVHMVLWTGTDMGTGYITSGTSLARPAPPSASDGRVWCHAITKLVSCSRNLARQ